MKVTANHIRLHVEERGEGDLALVFLHYWGGSSRTWTEVAAPLSATCRTVALDQRGWGQSEAPADGYRIADLADDAAAAVAALGLLRCVLVGHSMGGKVAQPLASRRPEWLAGLVLVAPAPPTPMAMPDEQRLAMLDAYDTPEAVGWALDQVLTARPPGEELRSRAMADSLGGASAAKRAWPTVGMLEDISAAVTAIEVPTLVIAGERDQIDRVETLEREVVGRIKGARLVT